MRKYNSLMDQSHYALSTILKNNAEKVSTVNERIMFALIGVTFASHAVFKSDEGQEEYSLASTYVRLLGFAKWLKLDLEKEFQKCQNVKESRETAAKYFKSINQSPLTAHLAIIRFMVDSSVMLNERLILTLVWIEEYFLNRDWDLMETVEVVIVDCAGGPKVEAGVITEMEASI